MTRPRGRVLLSVLTSEVLVTAGMLALPQSAGAVGQLNPNDFTLQRGATSAAALAALDNVLPRAAISTVLGDTNHTMTVASATGVVPTSAIAEQYGLDSADQTNPCWYPQGITTSADGEDTGFYNGQRVGIESWHYNGVGSSSADPSCTQGADSDGRVTLINLIPGQAPTYRHVLLVEPYIDSSGQANFRSIHTHADGVAWYGRYLYVSGYVGAAGSSAVGFRLFDVTHMYAVPVQSGIGRQSSGSYAAKTYAYIAPQWTTYTSTGTSAGFQWVSLDRSTSTPSLLTGAYKTQTGGGFNGVDNCSANMARWNITPTSDELYRSGGIATSVWADLTDICTMQGGASVNGKYYIVRAYNSDSDMVTWVPGNPITKYTGALRPASNNFSVDTHSLAGSTLLWSNSESMNNRYIYALKASSYP